MRNEIYQKVEELFHLKLEQLSGELQNTRHDFNRVSHELSLCEAELDQEKQEYVRAIEELKRQHELEVGVSQGFFVTVRRTGKWKCRKYILYVSIVLVW